ncbi:hypothetical protein KIPB_010251 [Kipferlia bialata]|uniref:Uncharacterized protein n=1 Tax=Kipferlia bialata TaxID=797122 RepID=A0A9K3D3G3_9EUKA|nr:hypothetical protein KIPB_010251 [Kipferlia bialata]|eukprot:g10251.t1
MLVVPSCTLCHRDALVRAGVYEEGTDTPRGIPGVENSVLAGMSRERFMSILEDSWLGRRGHGWTYAQLNPIFESVRTPIPGGQQMGNLVGNLLKWVFNVGPAEFSRVLRSLLPPSYVPIRVVASECVLPRSLWGEGESVRQYPSEYKLREALTFCTGREWHRVRDRDAVMTKMEHHTCTLRFSTDAAGVSLERLSWPMECSHRVNTAPSATENFSQPPWDLLSVPVPLVGTSMFAGISCETGADEGQVVGFSSNGEWTSWAVRYRNQTATEGGSIWNRGYSPWPEPRFCVVTHTPRGLESEVVECPRWLTLELPKAMCVVGGVLYVFVSIPDTAAWEQRVEGEREPPNLNRMYAMPLDTRKWVEVPLGEGFPSVAVSTDRVEGPRQSLSKCMGRVLMFGLEGSVYVILYKSECEYTIIQQEDILLSEDEDSEVGSGDRLLKDVWVPTPLTTMFRYTPEAQEGTDIWTQLPIGPLLKPSGVVVHRSIVHVFGTRNMTAQTVHLTFNPREHAVTGNGWAGGFAVPSADCDIAVSVGDRILVGSSLARFVVPQEYDPVTDTLREMSELVEQDLRLCKIGPDSVLQYTWWQDTDKLRVIHLNSEDTWA